MTKSFEKTVQRALKAQEPRANRRLDAIQDMLQQKQKGSPNPKPTKSQRTEKTESMQQDEEDL